MDRPNPDPVAPTTAASSAGAPRPRPGVALPRAAMLAVALLAAAGVGAGATALLKRDRAVTIVALAPQPMSALKDGAMAAVKGDVAEVFGNKFVVADSTGRALVETGRRGEGSPLVALNEPVMVQGRFEHGFLHAVAITHANGTVDTLDPPPPRHGGQDRGPGGPDAISQGPRPPA